MFGLQALVGVRSTSHSMGALQWYHLLVKRSRQAGYNSWSEREDNGVYDAVVRPSQRLMDLDFICLDFGERIRKKLLAFNAPNVLLDSKKKLLRVSPSGCIRCVIYFSCFLFDRPAYLKSSQRDV